MAKRRRQKTLEEKDELARLAIRLRYEEGMQAQEIRAILELSHTGEVTRLIDLARERKLFSIQYHGAEHPIILNDALARELVSTFDLRKAVVVDVDYDPESDADNDRLHKVLGEAMADVLRELLPVINPSSVGVGGGRAAYFTAKSLKENPLQLRQTLVMSLAGFMSSGMWEKGLEDEVAYLDMDPDYIVGILAQAIGTRPENITRVMQTLAYKTEEERNRHLNESAKHIAEEHWNTDAPEAMIMGIGTLEGGHRFRHPEATSKELAPIKNLLEQLNAMADQAKEKLGYIPIGVMCDHLFYISPDLFSKTLDPQEEEALEDMLKELTKRLLVISLDQLKKVKYVFAVAGGVTFQLHAIFYLLKRGDIHILCTDSKTAEGLIKAASRRT